MRYINPFNQGKVMYLNFFKRQWCDNSLKALFNEISAKFEIYALTLQHDKIYHPTFNERFITHIIIESSNDRYSFAVNDKLTYSDFTYFSQGYDEFSKDNKSTKNIIPMQKVMKSEVESTLGIDNNVNQDKATKITFCLNQYNSVERERILAFLANIDDKSPEVYIDIDMASSTVEQMQSLNNLLVLASIDVNS